jgi:hypothetical protein
MLRRVILVVLLLALPVQGALASSRWLCVAMSAGASHAAGSVPHAHDAAQHQNAAHAHVATHAHGDVGDARASHEHDRSHGNDDGGCSLCAACTVTAATPPVVIALAPADAAGARFAALDAAVPRLGKRGPERPPRTV